MAAKSVKLTISTDVLLKGGRVNTTELEKSVKAALGRLPTIDNVLGSGDQVIGDKTKVRRKFKEIAREAEAFGKAITDNKAFAKFKEKGGLFAEFDKSAAKQVAGIGKSFQKLDSLLAYDGRKLSKFFDTKLFKQDLARVQKNPLDFLNLDKGRQKSLREFAALQQDIAKGAASLRGEFTKLGKTDPRFLSELGLKESSIKATAAKLNKLNDIDTLRQKAAKIERDRELKFQKDIQDARKKGILNESDARSAAINKAHNEAMGFRASELKAEKRHQNQLVKQRQEQANRRFARESLAQVGGVGGIRGIPKGNIGAVRAGLADIEKRTLSAQKKVIGLRDSLRAAGDTSSKKFQNAHLGIAKLGRAAHEARKGINALDRRMSRFGSVVQQTSALFRQFLRFAIGYGGLFQALTAITSLTKSVSALDEALKGVQAVTQSTDAEMRTIEASIKQVALTTQFTTDEIAKAAKVLGQAGVISAEFPTALAATAQFASATSSSLELAADLVTTMRNVFKDLDDTTISNQLTKAVNISKLTAADLKTILSISAQTAKRYNIASEQYLGAAATLRDSGIKASTIATGFRRAANEIFSLDTRSIEAFRKRYIAINEDLSEEAIKARFFAFTQADNPFVSALEELKRIGFAGSGKEELARVFDIRAVNVISSAIDNLEKLKAAEGAITFGSTAAEGAEVQLRSLNKSLDNLGAAFTVFGDSVAADGVKSLQDFVDAGTSAVQVMTEFNEQLKANTGAGVGSTISPALLAGITTFAKSKATTPVRVAQSVAAAGATSVGLTQAENAGVTGATEAATTVLTGVFIADIFKRVFRAAGEKITHVSEQAASGSKGAALVAPSLESLRSLGVSIKTFFTKNIAGIIIGSAALIGTFLFNIVKTAKEDQKILEQRLRQANKNLDRQRAKTQGAVDAADEFDLNRIGGPKAGTTAASVERIVSEAGEIDSAIGNFFKGTEQSVSKSRQQLIQFLEATEGDAGSPNVKAAFSELTGFVGNVREAFQLANRVQGDVAASIQIAEQALNRFRTLEDSVRFTGGVDKLSAQSRAEYEGFQKFISTAGGLEAIDLLNNPSLAKPGELQDAMETLTNAIYEAADAEREKAKQSLEGVQETRDQIFLDTLRGIEADNFQALERLKSENLGITSESTPEEMAKAIERLNELVEQAFAGKAGGDSATGRFFNDLEDSARAGKEALIDIFDFIVDSSVFVFDKILESFEIVREFINSIPGVQAADEFMDRLLNPISTLIGDRYKTPREDAEVKDTFAEFQALLKKQQANTAEFQKRADERLLRAVTKTYDKGTKLFKGEKGQTKLNELKTQSPELGQIIQDILNGSAEQLIEQGKVTAAYRKFEKVVTGLGQQAKEEALSEKKARKNTINKLKEEADQIQLKIDLANSSLGDSKNLPDLFAEQAEVQRKLIEQEKKRLREEDGLTEAQAQARVLVQEQNKLDKLKLDAQKKEFDQSKKKKSLKELEEDLRAESSGQIGARTEEDKRIRSLPLKERRKAIRERSLARSKEFTKELRAGELKRDIGGLIKGGKRSDIDQAYTVIEDLKSVAQSLTNKFAASALVADARKLYAQAVEREEILNEMALKNQEAIVGEEGRKHETFITEEQIEGLRRAKEHLTELKVQAVATNQVQFGAGLSSGIATIDAQLSALIGKLATLGAVVRGLPPIPTTDTAATGTGEEPVPLEGLKTSMTGSPTGEHIPTAGVRGQTGGTLPGYGGGDKIPAMLEPGEEIIRKERASKYRDILKVINNAPSGKVREMVHGMRQKFNMGGTVRSGLEKYKLGGTAGRSGSPVYLQLPSGEQAGPLYGDADAVRAMKRMLNREAGKTTRRKR